MKQLMFINSKPIYRPCEQTIIRDGESYKLDPIVNSLLLFFFEHQNQPVSRQDIAKAVWPNSIVSDDAINRAVSVLRKALSDSREKYIKTIHRVGYQCTNIDSIQVQYQTEDGSLSVESLSTSNVKSASDSIFTDAMENVATDDNTLGVAQRKKANAKFTFVEKLIKLPLVIYRYVRQFIRGVIRLVAINRFARLSFTFASTMVLLLSVIGFAIERSTSQMSDVQLNAQQATLLLKPFYVYTNASKQLSTTHSESFDDRAKPTKTLQYTKSAILNNLSRTTSLIIIERNGDENRKVGDETAAPDYWLSASLNLEPATDTASLLIKLVENKTQALRFSHLVALSTEQINDHQYIAEQVGAAVRLEFQYPQLKKRYSAICDSLTPVKVEQLVSAIKYLDSGNEFAVKKAMVTLEALMQEYKNIPEIKAAYLTSVFNMERFNLLPEQELLDYLTLAEQVLLEQPDNFEALKFYTYGTAKLATLRHKAVDIAQFLVTEYQQNTMAWQVYLDLMVLTAQPCEVIENHLNAAGMAMLFSDDQLGTIRSLVNICLNNASFDSIDDYSFGYATTQKSNSDTSPISNQSIYSVVSSLPNSSLIQGMRSDVIGTTSVNQFHLYSIPRKGLRWLEAQLMLGQVETAGQFLKQALVQDSDYWRPVAQLYNELYGLNLPLPALSYEQLAELNIETVLPQVVAVLIKRNSIKASADAIAALKRVVEQGKETPVNIANREKNMTLIAAAYYAEQPELAKQLAQRLYQQLERYFESHPGSFSFWGLAKHQLVAGLYCGDACSGFSSQDASWLEQRARSGEPWWTHDLLLVNELLKPWREQPLTRVYLAKVSAATP